MENRPCQGRFRQARRALLLLLTLSCGAWSAHAGNIAFSLALTGTQLTLTHTGDSMAFFPYVFCLRADGRWEAALPLPPQPAATQILPGQHLTFGWPAACSPESPSALAQLRPSLVRFRDSAGVGFGQISFFTPPPAGPTIAAAYAGGIVHLSPPDPDRIRATWVLWSQEEGIGPLRAPLLPAGAPPPAARIDWRAHPAEVRFTPGAAHPSVFLLHESAQGLHMQVLASDAESGQQQRTRWLKSGQEFAALAVLLLALAMIIIAAQNGGVPRQAGENG